uniref:Protein kinase domain-containing protein n=1 Tax=Syphacia muris TaxID=451379 RepID=A0A0N5AMA4_9BILA
MARLPPPIETTSTASGSRESEASTAANVDDVSLITSFLCELSAREPRNRQQKTSANKPVAVSKTNLRIKMEYRNEKSCIEMERPVSFIDLRKHLWSKYSRQLNIYYTLSNNELIVPIRNQHELDRAVELLEKSCPHRSLRLILSQHRTDSGISNHFTSNGLQPDASGTYSMPSSRIVEIPSSECPSTSPSTRKYSPRSGGGSSASSGIFIRDYELDERRPTCTPRPPTNWKLGRCIGSGAFGQVFLCYDIDVGREVALKRLEFARNDTHLREQIVQLENEINLLSTIQHPRVVQYLGAYRTDDSLSIFMEYMAGGSVKDLIASYGALSDSVARKYTFQVLQGLAYLHRNEMIHRDIKTANILRDSSGNVKISDFGSAKRLQKICSQQTASMNFIGTPHYMAPEVVNQKSSYGRKADIWSLGCTLLEMLTGSPPWANYEPMSAIYNIATHNPPYKLPPTTDPSLVQLLTVLLERNPEKRPNASELLKSHPAFQVFVTPCHQ